MIHDEIIEGIGSIHKGEYDKVSFDGMGKVKGDITSYSFSCDGLVKVKGRITTEEFTCDGVMRVFRNIKAKKVYVDGILKLRGAKLEADSIRCDGILTCNREISADNVVLEGINSIRRLYGENIKIKRNSSSHNNNKLPIKLNWLNRLYFGRKLNLKYSLVDLIECTNLEANSIKSIIIRADNVILGEDCIIDTLECSGEATIHPSCVIKHKKVAKENEYTTYKNEIIICENKSNKKNNEEDNTSFDTKNMNTKIEVTNNNKTNNQNAKENNTMKNSNIEKVLEMYKKGDVNLEEASKLLAGIGVQENVPVTPVFTECAKIIDIPWEADGKLRIVVYKGRNLLSKGEAGRLELDITYRGEALDIDCSGNLNCGDIEGSATASGNIFCKDVDGSVQANGNINSGDIEGNANAGGSINCGDIEGSVNAGGDISCGNVEGGIFAGGNIKRNNQ